MLMYVRYYDQMTAIAGKLPINDNGVYFIIFGIFLLMHEKLVIK